MTHFVDAIFENGVLRPLTPLLLPDHARVRLLVDDPAVDDAASNVSADEEHSQWIAQSARVLMKTWDNAGDDIFNELLSP